MFEAERGVIGSIIMDNSLIKEICEIVAPEMFRAEGCRKAYEMILAMYDSGRKIDEITLSKELARSYSEGDKYLELLKQCVMDTPLSEYVKQYAQTVARDYRVFRVKEVIKNTDFSINRIDDAIGEVITKLEEIEDNKPHTAKSLSELVEENAGNYFRQKDPALEGIKLGFPKLDECLGGLQKGDITVIGARPSVGKSAFASQIIISAAAAGKKVGYFNLEMSDGQVYERMISRQAGLNLSRVRRANAFLGREQELYDSGNKRLSELNIVISTGSKTDVDIRNECRHQNFDLVVVDYLQLVRTTRRFESRRVEVGEVSRSMKAMAMELKVPVVLLSQLNRGLEYTAEKEPTMADLRETGDIEQDASVIIMLWRLSTKPELSSYKGLKVEKNRQGELMEEPLRFIGEYMSFAEMPDYNLEEVKDIVKTNESHLKSAGGYNPFNS